MKKLLIALVVWTTASIGAKAQTTNTAVNATEQQNIAQGQNSTNTGTNTNKVRSGNQLRTTKNLVDNTRVKPRVYTPSNTVSPSQPIYTPSTPAPARNTPINTQPVITPN
ncbi:MAG: hypothetical protein JWQ38_223 [Flavipsychrobacter sp.]|nr:hypothetical protein [Flavipsychrobacter sp.]